jgi:putative DNA primase/helicase
MSESPDLTANHTTFARQEFLHDTDDALAAEFSRQHTNLRYTAAWRKWHEWDGSGWVEDRTMRISEHVRRFVRGTRSPDPLRTRRLQSGGTISSIEKLARSDRAHAMQPEQWDADDWVLATPGGIVDLQTGNIRAARKEDYATKTTAVPPGGFCPLWLKFLDLVTDHDREMIVFLQRMLGYCLTGSVTEHALFFLCGPGGNGKSTLLETARSILGNYSRPAPPGC